MFLSATAISAVVVGVVGLVVSSRTTDQTVPAGPDPAATTSPMYSREVTDRDDWATTIERLETPSAFVVAEVGTAGSIQAAVPARAAEQLVPASTFELLNALSILETNAVADLDTVVPWDGVTRGLDSWNQDHTLRRAIQESASWVFEHLSAEVDPETMAAYVAEVGYGNADIGDAAGAFWLDGDLKTSAIDQLAFLELLVSSGLQFDRANQAMVVASLSHLDGPGWRLAYETGTALAGDAALAWLIGVVESGANQWVFAHNVDLPIVDGAPQPISAVQRLEVVVNLLRSAGLLGS